MAKLFSECLSQEVECLTERNKDGGKDYYIEGIFAQSDVYNRNRRRYPSEVLIPEIERYSEQFVNSRTAYGELDHPNGPQVSLQNASHMIVELKADGSDIYGKAKLLDTPTGDIAKGIIRSGGQLSVSTRGLGQAKKQKDGKSVIEKYFMTAVDIVSYPSAPSAFVNGVMESMDFMISEDLISKDEAMEIQSTVDTEKKMLALKKLAYKALRSY